MSAVGASTTAPPRLVGSSVVLAVADLKSAVAFYRDKLGFGDEWFWGNPPDWAGVQRGDVRVLFNRLPDLETSAAGRRFYIYVTGIDALYAEHKEKGVEVIQNLGDRPWGIREYTVRDSSGYEVRFGQFKD